MTVIQSWNNTEPLKALLRTLAELPLSQGQLARPLEQFSKPYSQDQEGKQVRSVSEWPPMPWPCQSCQRPECKLSKTSDLQQ